MASIDWHLQGLDVTSCSCDWGCPCQFMSLPTRGFCHAAVGFHIEHGHFGKVQLDGLSFGGLFAWPKAIHEGNGEAQPIIDVRANDAQRDAILKIMSGEETEPGATIFNVFAATYSKIHKPMFKPIIIEGDPGSRRARFAVEGVVDAVIGPIINPLSGAPLFAKVSLPQGFEWEEAELASSEVRTIDSPIKLAWQGRHAHIARLDMTGKGVVRTRAA